LKFLIFPVAVIVIFSTLASTRNRVWTGGASLWTDAVTKSPSKARPHNNLGISFDAAGEMDEAASEFRTAIRLEPDYLSPYGALAVVHGKLGELDKAQDSLSCPSG
jgi:Flp pilus assembly protein TadD